MPGKAFGWHLHTERKNMDKNKSSIMTLLEVENLHTYYGNIHALKGVSLTVNEVRGNRFGVNVISHTQAATTLGEAKVGHRVNLEVDMLARYVQRLLEHHKT